MALLDDFVTALDLASCNDGIVTRPQLLAVGLSANSIARLAEKDRALRSAGGGVYIVSALVDMRFGDYRLALQRVDPKRLLSQLAQDPLGEHSGVLSHHSAAALYGVVDMPVQMHVTVPHRRNLSGLTVHTAHLEPGEVELVEGLPVTTVERTTDDLGRWPMDGEHRSRWIDHCLDEGLLTIDRARELLGPSAEGTLMYLPQAA